MNEIAPPISIQEKTRRSARRRAGWKGALITLAAVLVVTLLLALGPGGITSEGPASAAQLAYWLIAGSCLPLLMVLFPVIGYGLAGSIHDYRLSLEAQAWPFAPGVIDRSEVEQANDANGGKIYRPALRYSFELAGRRFSGSRRKFGDHGPESANADIKRAEAIVESLPAGKAIDVAYDPSDPANNALYPVAFVWTRSEFKGQLIGLGLVALSPIVICLVIFLCVVLF